MTLSLLIIFAYNLGGADTDLGKMQSHIMATEAPQYKAYKVQLLRKVRTNTSVQLGISLDRIEVEPLVTHKHAFWVSNLYYIIVSNISSFCLLFISIG